MAKKQATSSKDIKSQIKEIEDKMFGLKNKKQKATLEKQIEALKIKETENKKNKQKKEIKPVTQKIPVGVDPKSVQCINWINKCCTDGDKCNFAHEVVKTTVIKEEVVGPIKVCRFLLDAINNKEYTKDWICPFPKCKDIHKLVDIKGDNTTEISLEEYLELRRQSLSDNLTPLTEETFQIWKDKKIKEDNEHMEKIKALSGGTKGLELFMSRPDIFKDDEEAGEVDYKERCYEEDEDE